MYCYYYYYYSRYINRDTLRSIVNSNFISTFIFITLSPSPLLVFVY